MKARIVAYGSSLIMIPADPESTDDNWVPTQYGKTGGSVLLDTKLNLEVSEKALTLMATIKKNRDAVGDLGWWACADGTHAFSWWGSIHRVVHVPTSEAARDFQIFREQCTIVPNDVPARARALVDLRGAAAHSWKEPISIPARKR